MSDKQNQIKPEVGMGATEYLVTDRNPYTIIEVMSEKRIKVQADNFKVIKGGEHDGSAEYEYSRNSNGAIVTIAKAKNGRWYTAGRTIQCGNGESYFQPGGMKHGILFALGNRRRYYDPHF